MEWILSNIAELATGLGITGLLTFIKAFIGKHKTIVAWIALRIEKDSADGKWTGKEKENLAVDLYFKQIIPMLPFQWRLILKLVPNFVEEKLIRSLIGKLCKKSHQLKGK